LYGIAGQGHKACRRDMGVDPSYSSNEKICAGQIEQVGIDESGDRLLPRRSSIDKLPQFWYSVRPRRAEKLRAA
jgi:hypothetical protein